MNSNVKILFVYFSIVLVLAGCGEKEGQIIGEELSGPKRPPIINMQMHTYRWNQEGDPPPPNQVSGVVPV